MEEFFQLAGDKGGGVDGFHQVVQLPGLHFPCQHLAEFFLLVYIDGTHVEDVADVLLLHTVRLLQPSILFLQVTVDVLQFLVHVIHGLSGKGKALHLMINIDQGHQQYCRQDGYPYK